MILLVHLLFGAAIGSVVNNIPLAIILAFLGHYFLDFFPHIEYSIENSKNKQWKKNVFELSKIAVDFCLGILLIFLLSKNQPMVYICAFCALIPDELFAINLFLHNKILEAHDEFHRKIHILENKKISKFWRIASQVIAVIISIILLKI